MLFASPAPAVIVTVFPLFEATEAWAPAGATIVAATGGAD
jgi:hypothetical protein